MCIRDSAEAVLKMAMGNGFGFEFADISLKDMFKYNYGAFLVEVEDANGEIVVGTVTDKKEFVYNNESISTGELNKAYEDKLEKIFSCNISHEKSKVENFSFDAKERVAPGIKVAKPKVIIPVFPGTNCEFDSAKAMEDAGAELSLIHI